MGRPRRSELLPLFRSEAQARVLAALFLGPDGEPSHIRGLAARAHLPYSTVQREVSRLEDAGIVHTTTFAHAKVVSPERSSPYFNEIQRLVLKSYGPATVLREVLEDAAGVVDAFIFGSWAARYHGEPGTDPGDIDVLIVTSDAFADADDLELDLIEQGEVFGRDVNVVFTTTGDWKRASSPFLATVKQRPLVPLKEPQDDA